jgi:hypothetical protein
MLIIPSVPSGVNSGKQIRKEFYHAAFKMILIGGSDVGRNVLRLWDFLTKQRKISRTTKG